MTAKETLQGDLEQVEPIKCIQSHRTKHSDWLRDNLSGNQRKFIGDSRAMGWRPLSQFLADFISMEQAGQLEAET
jgi:hypothetical protein